MAVDPVIVGLPAIGDTPVEQGDGLDRTRRHVVVPPVRLRSVPPPGSNAPESVALPVNGNGRAQAQAAESV